MRVREYVLTALAFAAVVSGCGREGFTSTTAPQDGGTPEVPSLPGAGNAGSPTPTGTPVATHADPAFGTMGRVGSRFGAASSHAHRAAVDPAGDIVLTGHIDANNTSNTALARYTPDGVVDATLGGNGWISSDLANGNLDWGDGIAILPNGTMYVSGSIVATTQSKVLGVTVYSSTTIATVARFTQSGSLDASFGSSGVLRLSMFDSGEAIALVAAADGSLWVGVDGYRGGTHLWSAVHVFQNGTIDPAWGSSGHADLGVSSYAALADLAVGGRAVLLGGTGGSSVDVARFDATGKLDATFGANGVARSAFAANTSIVPSSLTIDPKGRILACGTLSRHDASGASVQDAIVHRFLPSGALDATFGNAGVAVVDLGPSDEHGARAIGTADDHVMLAMSSHGLGIERLRDDGSPDTAWGPNGWSASSSPVAADVAQDLVALADGRWVVAGTNVNNPDAFVLAAFTP